MLSLTACSHMHTCMLLGLPVVHPFNFYLFVAVFIGKIIYEQLPGYNVDYLRDYMHAPVIVDAHLFGAITGIIFGISVVIYSHLRLKA